jgi:hypothetical protein
VLVLDSLVLVLGNGGGDLHHMQRLSSMGPRDWLKEASGFECDYS